MRKVLLLIALLLPMMVLLAQPPNKPPFDTDDAFVKSYTFEMAKHLEWDWEFEKAIWYYINLVPINIKQAALRIKNLKNHIGSPEVFIRTTFANFVMYDPEVNYLRNDSLITNKDVYEKKRAWADKLIIAVGK
ncbi:hypothetical protein BH09BAC1_BH09BAC1_10740 [soil metagenome]